jgi:shikimate dehydrogenase
MWDLADKGVMPNPGDTVLVLGAGGSARAVVAGLADSGCKVIVANRSRDRAERLVSELDSAAVKVIEWQKETVGEAAARAVLTINTTTIGMHPADSGNNSIINEGNFGSGQVFYDLVYSSSDTILMRIARTGGAKCFNGLGMLVRQGALSLSLWSGLSESQIPIQIMEQELIGHLA